MRTPLFSYKKIHIVVAASWSKSWAELKGGLHMQDSSGTIRVKGWEILGVKVQLLAEHLCTYGLGYNEIV